MDQLRVALAHYRANLVSEADQVLAPRTEANTQAAIYSQELSMVLVKTAERIHVCHRSEEAHARRLDRMMEIVARHVDSDGSVPGVD